MPRPKKAKKKMGRPVGSKNKPKTKHKAAKKQFGLVLKHFLKGVQLLD
jgi:hypothetical protein